GADDADRRNLVVESSRERGVRGAARHTEIVAAELRVAVETGALARDRQPPPDRGAVSPPSARSPANLQRGDLIVPAFPLEVADVADEPRRVTSHVGVAEHGELRRSDDP